MSRTPAPPPATPPRSLIRRLAWFVGIWAASVAALGIVAGVIRLWLH